jgi:hypothetical protein
MEVKFREHPGCLVCQGTSEHETRFLVTQVSIILPALSYRLAKEATLRTVVVLKAEVPHALLASAAHPRYVIGGARDIVHLYSYNVGILRQHQGALRCA